MRYLLAFTLGTFLTAAIGGAYLAYTTITAYNSAIYSIVSQGPSAPYTSPHILRTDGGGM
jgi:hypothetical protein